MRTTQKEWRELRSFGWIMGGFFTFILGILFPLLHHKPLDKPSLSIGIVLLALSFAAPPLLRPLQQVWLSFGVIMGAINTFILLNIFFYLIITPIAVLARFFSRKNSIGLPVDLKLESYRCPTINNPRSQMQEPF